MSNHVYTKQLQLLDGHYQDGNLDLRHPQIFNQSKIPDNLTVNGWLDCANNRGISEMGDNIKVMGYFSLTGTGVRKIGKGLECSSLYLSGNITELPKDLIVHKSIIATPSLKSANGWVVSGRIGSRGRISVYNKNTDTVYCGCLTTNLEAFKAKVIEVHAGTKHETEYLEFINRCKA